MTALLNQYLNYLSDTESPVQYHRWAFLSGVGAVLSRKVWFNYGHVGRIYPNMYTLLVGSPGTRKDSAIRPIREIVSQAGFTALAAPGRTTAWEFVNDLADGLRGEIQAEELRSKFKKKGGNILMDIPSINDSSSSKALEAATELLNSLSKCDATDGYICLGEFKDFLDDDYGEFSTLLTTLWDNLPIYEHKKGRSSPVRVLNPTISILGGCTPTGLHGILTDAVSEQGLTSRMILVYGGKPEKKITFPSVPSALERNSIVEKFEAIALLTGEMKLSQEAMKLLETIYEIFDEKVIFDGRLQYYLSRRLVHLLKICIILAASDLSMTITSEHVTEANTILAITERFMSRALGEFGESRVAVAKQQLTEKLQSLSEPVARQKLFAMVANHIDDIQTFEKILGQLILAGRLVDTKCPAGVHYYSMAADFQPEFKTLPGIDISYIKEISQLEESLRHD